MFDKPSLTNRIIIGKLIGLVFGLIGFFALPYFWPEADLMIRVGVLFWYPTLGAIVGVYGVFTSHPIIHLPLPWWFRATAIGAWMNLVLTFFAYDVMSQVMVSMFGANGIITSPFWFVSEGAIVGLIIGYFATKFGGEGKETVEN
jgi:hypothetical protein